MKSNLKKRSKKFNHAPEKNLVLKQRAIYDIVKKSKKEEKT